MRKYISVGIGLDKPTLDRIDSLGTTKGVTRNELVRKLIDLALPHVEKAVNPDIGRLLILQEHQTLVLDALARKHIPEQADRLAVAAFDNVKRHHGS